ncbi:replication initiator protein [Salmonella enterica subsp. enterica]|nr:replication initiator protein [Salmonella enterica subsp. enterica]ECH9021212.1 replication initiator protein [Salmonella enterica subsp. enterica]
MGSCAAPSAKGDDKFITTDYLQQCPKTHQNIRFILNTSGHSMTNISLLPEIASLQSIKK